MKTIVGLDVETTDLCKPENAPLFFQPQIIEFCFLVFNLKNNTLRLVDTYESLVKPTVEIPFYITKMTKIEPYMVQNEKPFKPHLKKAKKIIESADLFVAQNATFDRDLILLEAKREKKEILFPELFCTVERNMHLKGIRLKNSELYEHYMNEPAKGLHRAKNDIIETMQIFAAMHNYKIKGLEDVA